MKPHLLLLLSGLLLGLPWSSLRAADDAEAKAVAFVMKFGGQVERDDKAPGKPVRGVKLCDCDGWKGPELTDAGLKELTTLKQLQSLNLSGCRLLTNAVLMELASLQQLQSLILYGCRGVSDKEMEKLKKAIPKLQVYR